MPSPVESWRRAVSGYGAAILCVLLAHVVRLAFQPWLIDRSPYLLFPVAILAAAFYGGTGPAILATLAAAALGTISFGPSGLHVAHLAQLLSFLAAASGIILLRAAMGRWRRRATLHDEHAAGGTRDTGQLNDELNLLIDGAVNYAIYMLDPEGRVTIWNKGAERLTGWKEGEVIGRSCALFYPAEEVTAGKPAQDLARARRDGKLEEENWRVRKDGSEFLAHVLITALYDEFGALRGFGKVVRDITDQKAKESAIRASETHLRSILSTVPDAMIIIDERGAIMSFSAAAERLFGYSETEISGMNVSCLMPSPDRERHDDYIAHYLATGERRVIGIGRVVIGMRRDGSTFPMELSVGEAAVDGRRIFTGFIRDLTERLQTQEHLEELQSELLHVSRISAMGAMASTLAHELNQPITAVTNYVEAARDLLARPDPDDLPMIREALDEAASESLRAGDIVRRLREFVSRGEVEKTIEELPELIDKAATLGLAGTREKGVEVSLDLGAEAASVLVDRVQIQQVLINLMRNAIEAMGDSPVRRLSIATRDQGPGLVRVTVADTGHGVAPAIADQLFRAFVSTKREGMGLGLSICRTIVEANGGRIWLETPEQGGSMFHFTLVKAQSEKMDVG
ncbi:PAS domain S-box protein [Sphingomonas oleivorans]|nr:PAS domain S-box protein [Sphingomonas oleivorans]